METLNRVIRGDYTDSDEDEREDAVREVIQVASMASAAVAIQPIPVVDTVLVIPIQIALVQAIGRVHGHSLDKKSVLEILSSFGAGIVAQNVIMAGSKLIPFLGWIVAPSMAYALTYAVGEVAHYYFQEGRGVDPDDLRSMFQRVYKQKRSEKEERHKEDDTLKQRLKDLKEAYKRGVLTAEEFQKKKSEILDEF